MLLVYVAGALTASILIPALPVFAEERQPFARQRCKQLPMRAAGLGGHHRVSRLARICKRAVLPRMTRPR
jgi:hypothetical protein